jgi:DNA segregation ATPase FtsK/SpoIIIE, S-DNA-T family
VRVAAKKRPHKVRPKTPSRVKKRTRRSRGHQHPELIGLGLAAFGLFMATVLYVGWNGGYVGKAIGDALIALVGGIAYVIPVASMAIGLLMVARSDLPSFRPFRIGLAVTTVGLAMLLGAAHGGYLGQGL